MIAGQNHGLETINCPRPDATDGILTIPLMGSMHFGCERGTGQGVYERARTGANPNRMCDGLTVGECRSRLVNTSWRYKTDVGQLVISICFWTADDMSRSASCIISERPSRMSVATRGTAGYTAATQSRFSWGF